MTTVTPTEKQAIVLRELRAGYKPPEIAARLGTTTPNIYNHIRKLRSIGVELPEFGSASAAPMPSMPRDVVTVLENATAQANAAIERIDAELARREEQIAGLLRERKAHQELITSYAQAISDLQGAGEEVK